MFFNIKLYLCNIFYEEKLNNNREKCRDPLFIAYSGIHTWKYECHRCQVTQISVFSTYPVFRTQCPLPFSVSTPTTNSAARVPINLLPPPALVSSGVPWTYSPGSPLLSPRASQRLVSRRVRAETSSVVNIDQLLTETAHDPRDLCPVTPEDHGYTTAHNGNGLSYNRKIICLSSSLLFSAQSLPSPQSLRWRFVLAVSEINDVFPFNCGAQDAVIWLQSVLLGPTSGRNWTLLGNNFILFRIVQNSLFIAMWWHFPGTWWNRC